MKLLSIQPSPSKQGPAIQHLRFLSELKKHGVEHYLVLESGHPMAADFEAVCEDILWVKGNREGIVPRSVSPVTLLKYFKHTRQLQKQIGDYAIEKNIQLIWTVNEAYLAGPLAAKYANIPNCSQVFGMTAFRMSATGKLLALFHRRYSKRIIPCQDLIATEIAALGYPKDNINVVYNGVDVEKIISSVTNDVVRTNTIKNVGMVAGLDRRKGHLLFVEAAKHVVPHYPNVKFYLIGSVKGDDEYLAEIKGMIDKLDLNEHIVMTGKVDNIYNYIHSLDVHCIPSKIEALSVAGLEAMALSKPVVGTDVGGNFIAIKNGVTGTLTPAEDASQMGKAIVALLEDSDLAKNYGHNGKQLVEKQFTLQQSAANLHESFGNLLEKQIDEQ